MTSMTIPGSAISRAALIEAVSKVPQRPEWVVIDAQLQPLTFVQELDRFEGATIGEISKSAEARVTRLEAEVDRGVKMGWAGVGLGIAGGIAMAVAPPLAVPGFIVAFGGVAGVANWGFTGAKWGRDEIASVQGFAEQLGEWGRAISQPAQTAQASGAAVMQPSA